MLYIKRDEINRKVKSVDGVVNNFLNKNGLQEKLKPRLAECLIHVLGTILHLAVG